jgi:hypothetical protein
MRASLRVMASADRSAGLLWHRPGEFLEQLALHDFSQKRWLTVHEGTLAGTADG